MGFTSDAVSKLTFKVQAANVIDANTNFQWYESVLENSPKITEDRIFLQYNTVTANPPTSTANLVTLTSSGGALHNIVSNNYENAGTPVYHQLTQATNGNDTTYVSYDNPADRNSDRKNNWINPSSVPVNGIPVPYYTIEIYYLVGTTYIQLQATDAATVNGEVGWVWNYDQGLLLLSSGIGSAIEFMKNANSGTMPDLYVRGWRYIGDTGVGTGGDKYADCTTQTIVFPITTQTISLTIGTDLSYTQGQSVRLTSGSNLILGTVSSYVASTGAIVIAITSSSGNITTSATWCIALGGGSGGSIEVESFDYSDDPNNPGTPIGLTTLTTALEGLQIPTDLSGGGLIAEETSPGSNIITLNTRFDTQISPTTNAQAVGGISNSETAASLSTLTFTELFNKLLFPTLLPTYKRPLFTISKTTSPSQTYYQPGQSVTVNTSTIFTKQDSGGIDGTIITNRNGSPTPSMGTATSGTTGDLPSQFGFTNNNTPNTTNTRTASETFTTSIPTTSQTASDTFNSNTGWLQGNANKDSTGALDTRTPAVPNAATVNDPIAALASYNSSSTSILSVYPWYYFYSSTKPTSSDAVSMIQGSLAIPGGYTVVENLVPSNGTLNVLNYTPAAVFTVVAYPFLANNNNFPVKTRYFLSTLNQNPITNLFDPVVTVNISRNGGPWSNIQYRMHISTSVQQSTISPLELRNN
jgi:hypothetical protein